MRKSKKFNPNKTVTSQLSDKAIHKILKTLSSELLESAKVAAYKLKQYFNEIDLKELDRNGKPVHDAKKLVSTIGSIGETITGIESLEDKVLKEKELNSKLRGSREKKMFEDPE